jgi:hypothetical protein
MKLKFQRHKPITPQLAAIRDRGGHVSFARLAAYAKNPLAARVWYRRKLVVRSFPFRGVEMQLERPAHVVWRETLRARERAEAGGYLCNWGYDRGSIYAGYGHVRHMTTLRTGTSFEFYQQFEQHLLRIKSQARAALAECGVGA